MARLLSWLARICAVGTLLIALGGCLRYHVDMTVSADQRVSGTVIVAIRTRNPDLVSGRITIPPDLAAVVTERPYDRDGYLGLSLTLDRLTFDQVGRLFERAGTAPGTPSGPAPSRSVPSGTAPTGPGGATATRTATAPGAGGSSRNNQDNQNRSTFSFRRDGELVRVSGVTSFPLFAFSDSNGDFDARITLTFPGEIVSTNGQRQGRTVRWQISPDRPTRISVVARLSDVAPAAWVPWALAGGGALLVLLAGSLVTLLVRRRRAAVPAGAAPVFDAAQFQTFLDDHSWYPPAGPPDPASPGGVPHGGSPAPPYAPPPAPGHLGQPGQPGQDQNLQGQPWQTGQPGQWPPQYPESPYR